MYLFTYIADYGVYPALKDISLAYWRPTLFTEETGQRLGTKDDQAPVGGQQEVDIHNVILF